MKTSSVLVIALAACFSPTVFADGVSSGPPAFGQPSAAKNTPITWAEATRSPEYKAFDDAEKEEFRQMYWREIVAPTVPDYKLEEARTKFDAETGPTSPQYVRTLEALRRFMVRPENQPALSGPQPLPPPGTTCEEKVYNFPGWIRTCTTCQAHNISNTVCD